MKKIVFNVIVIFVSSGVFAAEEARLEEMPVRLSLDEALDIAQEYNPSLQQARTGIISMGAAIREVRAARLPQVSGIADYTRYDENRLQAFGPDATPEDSTWSTRAEASMALFSGGRNKFAVRGAKANKIASEYDLKQLEQDLAVMVQNTYLNAILAQASAAAQQEELDMLEDQFSRSEKKFNAGVGSKFEMLQAEVVLANAKPALVREKNNYRREVDRLSRLLGLPIRSTQEAAEIKLLALAAPRPLLTQMQEALTIAEKQRPELAALANNVEAQQNQLLVYSRGNWPLLEAFGNYGLQSDQFGGDNLKGWTAGLRVNWSFIDGGARRAKVDQAKAQLLQLEQRRKELLLQVSGEVRESLYDYEEAWEILHATDKVIQQADEALRMSQDRHESGKGTQLDVFEAQTQLTQARLSRLKAEQSCHLAEANFRRALGE